MPLLRLTRAAFVRFPTGAALFCLEICLTVYTQFSLSEMEGAADAPAAGGGSSATEELREQDRLLPIANVARIMKRSLPASAKVAQNAKDAVQESVSELIAFITSEASERCVSEKRKTITGEDILYALQTLGFTEYVEPLRAYLQRYRESQ